MGANRFQIAIWAGVMFFGFNLLGGQVSRLLIENFGVDWNQAHARPWDFPNVFLAAPLTLLVLSYLHVGHLKHDILAHLWLYAIIAGAIGLISGPVLASFHTAETLGWGTSGFGLARFIVLVWFARKASAISLGHSLLFIGLISVMESTGGFHLARLQDDPPIEWPIPIYVTLVTGEALLRGFAVWTLVKIRTVTSYTRIVALLAVVMVVSVAALFGLATVFSTPSRIQDLFVPGFAALSWMIAPALAMVVTYAVRVRRRTDQDVQHIEA